jgi:hypothetical protein
MSNTNMDQNNRVYYINYKSSSIDSREIKGLIIECHLVNKEVQVLQQRHFHT